MTALMVSLGSGVAALACVTLVVPRVPVSVVRGDPPPHLDRVRSPTGIATAFLVAVLGSLSAWAHPPELVPMWLWFCVGGAVLAATDMTTTYLPRLLVYPFLGGLGVCLGWAGWRDWPLLAGGLLGSAGMVAIFWVANRLRVTAFGDVRLSAAPGMAVGALGLTPWWQSLVLTTLLGALVAVLWRLRGNHHSPYGPSLILGPLIIAAWS